MVTVHEYIFTHGNTPTGATTKYPRQSRTGTTTREQFKREDGIWVVRWTYDDGEDG